MKFLLKYKAILVLSVFCIISAVIAGKVTFSLVHKPKEEKKEMRRPEKRVFTYPKTMKECHLVVEGKKWEGLKALIVEDNKYMIPVDFLQTYYNKEYQYFPADDIIKIEGKNGIITLKKNTDSLNFNEEDLRLDVEVFHKDSRIYVSAQVMQYINDFNVEYYGRDNTLYINRRHENILDFNAKRVSYDGERLILYDQYNKVNVQSLISNSEKFTYEKIGRGRNGYLFKAGELVYWIYDGNGIGNSLSIPSGTESGITEDNKYFYYYSQDSTLIHIVNLESGNYENPLITKRYRDNSVSLDQLNLIGYIPSRSSIISKWRNLNNREIITYIESGGDVRNSKSAHISPLGMSLLINVNDVWHIMGRISSKNYFESKEDVRWLTENTIGISNLNKSMNIGSVLLIKDEGWRVLGWNNKGVGYFYLNDSLYKVDNGSAEELSKIDSHVESCYQEESEDPLILFSPKDKKIVWFENEVITEFENSQVFNHKVNETKETNIQYSLDKDKFFILKTEGNTPIIHIFARDGNSEVFFIKPLSEDDNVSYDAMWIDNTRIIVFVEDRGQIVDLQKPEHISEWKSEEGTSVIGFVR